MSLEVLKEEFVEMHVTSVLDESIQAKRWFIEGITLQSNVKNHNGRIYPKEILERAITEHVDRYLKSGRAVGELNHPTENSAQINPENISHKFISVKEDKDNFVTKAQLLNTPKGLIAQNLLEAGVQLGISSRGLGSIKESNGAKVIQDFKIVALGDIVFEPSGPECFVAGIMEGQQWVYDNGILVKKELSEEMDVWKTTLKEAKSSEINAAASQIMKDYLNKLFK